MNTLKSDDLSSKNTRSIPTAPLAVNNYREEENKTQTQTHTDNKHNTHRELRTHQTERQKEREGKTLGSIQMMGTH